jgi:hypothetical protein
MRCAAVALAYNTPDLVASIRDQLPGVLVVDNGSSPPVDGAAVRLESNLYFAGGWNAAMQQLPPDIEYVWMLNTDLLDLRPFMLGELAAILDRLPPWVAAVSPAYNSPWPWMWRHESGGVRLVNWLDMAGVMIRRSAWNAVGEFDAVAFPGWACDRDWCLRAAMAGYGVGVVDSLEFYHIGGATMARSGGWFQSDPVTSRAAWHAKWGDVKWPPLPPLPVATENTMNAERALADLSRNKTTLTVRADDQAAAPVHSVDVLIVARGASASQALAHHLDSVRPDGLLWFEDGNSEDTVIAVQELFWARGLKSYGGSLAVPVASNRIMNVITAVSRPEFIPEVRESLNHITRHAVRWYALGRCLVEGAYYTELCEWNIVGGVFQKNRALDLIHHGLVWHLDDDNVVHPDFDRLVAEYMLGSDALVLDQIWRDGTTHHTCHETRMAYGFIDQAQYVLRRAVIGDYRQPPVYWSDVLMFQAAYKNAPHVRFVNQVGMYYNYLRQPTKPAG